MPGIVFWMDTGRGRCRPQPGETSCLCGSRYLSRKFLNTTIRPEIQGSLGCHGCGLRVDMRPGVQEGSITEEFLEQVMPELSLQRMGSECFIWMKSYFHYGTCLKR